MGRHRRQVTPLRRRMFEIRLTLENRWHAFWKPALKKWWANR